MAAEVSATLAILVATVLMLAAFIGWRIVRHARISN
jgi:hypothetical protein